MLNCQRAWLSVSLGRQGSEHVAEAFLLVLGLSQLAPTSLHAGPSAWNILLCPHLTHVAGDPALCSHATSLRVASLTTSATTFFPHLSQLFAPLTLLHVS